MTARPWRDLGWRLILPALLVALWYFFTEIVPMFHQALLPSPVDVLIDACDQVRAKATMATERTADYIREQPVKSVLMAAAGGAALMALLSLGASRRKRRA